MHTYNESGLQLNFGSGWAVRKYDEHRFYKGLSGAGLKGMDFVGILNWRQLVLFEVKNYRIRNGLQPPATVQDQPELLAQAVAAKVVDTFTAVDAIVQYFRRQWIYRQFIHIIQQMPFPQSEWIFWTKAYELMQNKQNCMVFLLIELDEPKAAFREMLNHLLSEDLYEYAASVSVDSHSSHPFSGNLKILLDSFDD